MDDVNDKQFFTDKQLCARWNCSHMKLWRLRQKGKLPRPLKLGGIGQNLTATSAVRSVEAEGGGDASAA